MCDKYLFPFPSVDFPLLTRGNSGLFFKLFSGQLLFLLNLLWLAFIIHFIY